MAGGLLPLIRLYCRKRPLQGRYMPLERRRLTVNRIPLPAERQRPYPYAQVLTRVVTVLVSQVNQACRKRPHINDHILLTAIYTLLLLRQDEIMWQGFLSRQLFISPLHLRTVPSGGCVWSSGLYSGIQSELREYLRLLPSWENRVCCEASISLPAKTPLGRRRRIQDFSTGSFVIGHYAGG